MKDVVKFPLVSVGITTYNQKEYLRECIESVLSQDYENIQIVIGDDASTDGTQDMLKEYKEKYPGKFTLILSEQNQGITKNSNIVHFACKGEYIAWMGGDDLMNPGKIKAQVDYMQTHPQCTISYHNLEIFESSTNKILGYFNAKKSSQKNGDVRDAIKYGTFNGACSNMVRRSKTPSWGFDESVPVASDWLYWVDTLANGGTIDYMDKVFARYRRHNNNITTVEKNLCEIDHLNSCNIILLRYPEYFKEALYAYARNIRALRHRGNYFEHVFRSFFISPNVKALAGILINLLSFNKLKP